MTHRFASRLATAGAAAALFLGIASNASAAGWTPISSSGTTNDLASIDCVSADICVAVGSSGTIVRTTNKKTWAAVTSPVTSDIASIDFYSSSVGVAVGQNGVLLRSTDSGATWTQVSSSATTEFLYAVKMGSSTTGWAVGEDGKVLKTTDSGANWSVVTTIPTADYRSVDATSSTAVWVGGKNGTLYKSTDGGTSWTLQTTGTTETIDSIDMYSSSVGYFAGTNRLFAKTTDGTTWTPVTLTGFDAAEIVRGVQFYTSTSGTAVGLNGHLAQLTASGSTQVTITGAAGLTAVVTYAVGAQYAVGTSGAMTIFDNYAPSTPTNFTTSSLTNDTTPSFTWTASTDNESSVAAYWIAIDGGSAVNVGSGTSYSPSTALSAGSHTATILAEDVVGNGSAVSSAISFTIDTTAPTVGSTSPTTATAGTATQFTVTASDANGLSGCSLYLNSSSAGAMSVDSTSGGYYLSYTFSAAGTYSAYAYCTDSAGNSVAGSSTSVTVAAASTTTTTTTTDTTAPTVGAISTSSVTEDTSNSYSVSYSDSVGVTSCTLYVSGSSVGSMTLSGTTASKSYTFSSPGSYTMYVKCSDAAGNIGTGSSKTVTVSAATTTAASEADFGDLIKTDCGSSTDVNDPCRAVYYYDGKRHAFPNEKVYFSWYEDFDDLVIVTDDFMQSITLGINVTYHPGSTMVKLQTLNTVYCVDAGGVLRGITSETIASSIFGSDWNTQIDDISDAFHNNYTYGDVVDSTSDFDPDEVYDSISTIAENFEAAGE
jgi:photosystem II stability/assembly factor-like uncharacterized protein